jgi:anti-anti-sigma regulatory factor
MLTLTQEADGQQAVLEGELSIFDAQTLFEQLKPCLEQGGDLTLDLARVSRVDSSIVQIFMLARQHLQAKGYALRLVHHSEAAILALENLGLVGWFHDPVLLSREGVQP